MFLFIYIDVRIDVFSSRELINTHSANKQKKKRKEVKNREKEDRSNTK